MRCFHHNHHRIWKDQTLIPARPRVSSIIKLPKMKQNVSEKQKHTSSTYAIAMQATKYFEMPYKLNIMYIIHLCHIKALKYFECNSSNLLLNSLFNFKRIW